MDQSAPIRRSCVPSVGFEHLVTDLHLIVAVDLGPIMLGLGACTELRHLIAGSTSGDSDDSNQNVLGFGRMVLVDDFCVSSNKACAHSPCQASGG